MDWFNLFRRAMLCLLGSPAKKTALSVGVNDGRVEEIQIDLLNKINLEKFKSVPKRERMLVLPQCLRSRNCPARVGEYGYACQKCGKCIICRLCEDAKAEGYLGVFIVPGASVVSRLLKKYKPRAVLAVACTKELVPASAEVEKLGIAAQAVPLFKDGCVNTLVDRREVLEKLKLL